MLYRRTCNRLCCKITKNMAGLIIIWLQKKQCMAYKTLQDMSLFMGMRHHE